MKTLLFLATIFFSFGCGAQIVCPQPKDLKSDLLTFIELPASDVANQQSNDDVLFLGSTLFEADNKVWQLVIGFFDENRPRLQAKRLLEKATSPTIEYGEDGEESCAYLNDSSTKIPKLIYASPAPEIKPCPSLQQMKNTYFSTVIQACSVDNPGCSNYITMAELEDRGTNWLFLSFDYSNEATAILETEELKQKAFGPIIDEYCTYFFGATKQGVRAILAVQQNPKVENINTTIKNLKSKINYRQKFNQYINLH